MAKQRLFLIILCLGLLIAAGSAFGRQPSPHSPVAPGRLAALKRGVNISGWFAQVYDAKGYTKEHFESWIGADDIARIKAMGFDHIRLSINPAPMFHAAHPEEIPADYLSYLDTAVRMILDHGLAVIVDIQPDDDFKARFKDDVFVQQVGDFWRSLARHYSKWNPDRVFLEVMNEPEVADPYRWYGIETRWAAAIRQGAPDHTILATGAAWSNNDELVFGEPLRDANVIYSFHFYFPYLFTHQGATWGAYNWQAVKGLRYPSSPESAAETAATVPDPRDRLAVIRYGYEHWDAARLDAEIAQVAEWARSNDVPVMCSEFGVYRDYANPHDRAAWLNDMRSSFEKHGIGWTVWDYNGTFGVVTKTEGHSSPDALALFALGLKIP